MKNFIKNNGQWIRVCVILAVIIFAAGKIHNSHTALCREIETKLDKELYDRELTQVRKQLDRIEEKVDALINREYKNIP